MNASGSKKFKQLLDAANFLWYGGGLKDKNTLSELSALVGDHDVERWSNSRSGGVFDGGSSSKSQSWSKEAILTVDDLGFDHRGGQLFMAHLRSREMLAKKAGSASPSALGVKGF